MGERLIEERSVEVPQSQAEILALLNLATAFFFGTNGPIVNQFLLIQGKNVDHVNEAIRRGRERGLGVIEHEIGYIAEELRSVVQYVGQAGLSEILTEA